VAAYPDVERVAVDGHTADPGPVEHGAYKFWTVEHLYTYGSPAAGTSVTAFLDYIDGYTAKDILRSQGYIPCVDQQQDLMSTLCRQ